MLPLELEYPSPPYPMFNHTRRVSEEATAERAGGRGAELRTQFSRTKSQSEPYPTIGLLVTASANPFFAEVVKGE